MHSLCPHKIRPRSTPAATLFNGTSLKQVSQVRVRSRNSAKLILCLAAVYFVWGSSFLFTKIAVSNLPIALFFAIRFLTAGTVLAAIARFWNKDTWPRRLTDWRHMLVAGFFM